MTDAFTVPLGTPSKLAYLIRLDEDTWFRYSDEQREQCKAYWREQALGWRDESRGVDIRIICLQLLPDPIFPTRGKETPYVIWQERVLREGECAHDWTNTIAHVKFLEDWHPVLAGRFCPNCREFHPHTINTMPR